MVPAGFPRSLLHGIERGNPSADYPADGATDFDRTAPLVTNDGPQVPISDTSMWGEQPATEPDAATSNEDAAPGTNDSMDVKLIREIVPETLAESATSHEDTSLATERIR